jgi:Tol biopolymer transport system component
VFSPHPIKFLGVLFLIGLAPFGASSQSLRKIAFTHGGTVFASKIAVINEDGTGLTDLTGGGQERDPTWSPDGSQIAFFDNRYGGTNLIRMNADGTAQVPLTDSISPVGSSQPAWSPDGTRIAFVTNRTEVRGAEIWVIKADGTNPTRVTTNVQRGTDSQGPYFSLDLQPAWSPDSSKITFWSNRDDSANAEIYMINADGSNLVRLTNNSIEDKEPIFSADGQHVVFFSRGNGRDGIYEIDLNGSNDHKLTTGFNPTISEDGQKLIVTDFDPAANFAFALFIMNADGSNRTKLTDTGETNS